MRKTLGILSTLSFLFGTAFTYAQAAGAGRPASLPGNNIAGYIRDAETNEALPFANVLVKDTKYGAATNANGYFVVVGAPAVVCTLQVRYVGYATREIVVDNTRSAGKPLEVKMERVVVEIDGITVEEKVQMLDATGKVGELALSPPELITLPTVGEVDVFRSLQLLPGISGVSDGSSGLYVRGGTPDQNLVLFDGMTIYHVDHFFGLFSAFNADAIKDIRVYKGGFPAEFGGRTSSVVNLTGKTGDVNKLRYGAGMNLLSGHGVVEVPLMDNLTFLLSARRSYTDVVQSSLYNKLFDFISGEGRTRVAGAGGPDAPGAADISQGTENPDFYFFDLNSKVTFTPTPQDIFTLSIYSGRDNLAQAQSLTGQTFGYVSSDRLFEDPDASLNTEQLTRWGNSGLSGKWSRKMSERLYSHLLVSHSTYFSKYDMNRAFTSNSVLDSLNWFRGTATTSREDNELRDLSVHLDNEWHLSNSHDLKLGLGVSGYNVHYYATLNDTTRLLWRQTEAMQGNFYLQDLWKLTPDLELTAGIRGTYYDQTASVYQEPRASVVYALTGNVRLKGAWGRYYQFVNRITNENVLEGSRDFWILADDDLEPSFAEHWIVGTSYENDDFLLDLEAYYKDLDKIVEYSRRASYGVGMSEVNPNLELLQGTGFFQGTGFARGVDILAQKKTGRLTGWIGYSLGKVRYEFPQLNNGRPYPAPHDRTHELNIVGKVSLGNWEFSSTWVYASGKAYTVPESQYYLEFKDGTSRSYIHISDMNSYRLPEYHRLDLSISRSFETKSTSYVLGFSIFNLYNNKNIWYRQFNLETVPVAVTDVKMLSFTPTVYFQVYSK
ncbi:MAG: TonB-dependent receptor [Candidatus Glassbacteria bacterium]|nr:TonB-dependent receptor [Candidatus Glassbacteria bacterium]